MTIVKAFENRIPEVSQSLLHRLRAVHGFSEASCVKALYHTGGRSLSEAVEWIYNHIEDPDLHQFIEVPVLVVRFLCDACIELTGCSGSFLSFSALERHVSVLLDDLEFWTMMQVFVGQYIS